MESLVEDSAIPVQNARRQSGATILYFQKEGDLRIVFTGFEPVPDQPGFHPIDFSYMVATVVMVVSRVASRRKAGLHGMDRPA
ncbi:hypothetical protein [Rhizorhapis sp.]|uniref:hypothetical protein n=1 Tax=Rhizorhapis sp. TaxID=1968842 RepID=UPI002B458D0D|nr:hypothetical protein [Rhizorhapis sp.]HKR15927.1 hypothetical protein [Rhizorhapis sp.]